MTRGGLSATNSGAAALGSNANTRTALNSVLCCLTHSKKTRLTPLGHSGSSSSIYRGQCGWDRQVSLEDIAQVVVWPRVGTGLAGVPELSLVLWYYLGGG